VLSSTLRTRHDSEESRDGMGVWTGTCLGRREAMRERFVGERALLFVVVWYILCGMWPHMSTMLFR
jgi:hypothetical protein